MDKDISIYQLWKAGGLDLPIKLGVVRLSVIEYCRIYDVYIGHRQAGKSYTQAVELTSETLFLTEGKVKYAIAAVL